MRREATDTPLLDWRRPSAVVPFPASRRRDFIRRVAGRAATFTEAGAASHIDTAVRKHRERLDRLGVQAKLAEDDAATLRGALYVELARLLSRWGGAA